MSELAFIDSAGVAIINQNLSAMINSHGINTSTHSDIRQKIDEIKTDYLPLTGGVINGNLKIANEHISIKNEGHGAVNFLNSDESSFGAINYNGETGVVSLDISKGPTTTDGSPLSTTYDFPEADGNNYKVLTSKNVSYGNSLPTSAEEGDIFFLTTKSDYSEEEIATGDTWIDGRMIYSRYFTFSPSGTGSWQNYDTGLTADLAWLDLGKSFFLYNGISFPLSFYQTSTGYCLSEVTQSTATANVIVQCKVSVSPCTAYFRLCYVKAADYSIVE